MVSEPLNAADIIPQIVQEHWKDSIQVHAFLIVDAIRPDGSHGLHAVHDEASPPWVLIGMLRSILVDLESRWINEAWVTDDEEDENDDD
jgi:hypothetical protein